ncbi:MAG: hypothetical protein C0597_10105 [Marinilabiliales bacterium]|nr:MAG: hypothetical protein C0597_10105 [Marinilabiliales bacterium]
MKTYLAAVLVMISALNCLAQNEEENEQGNLDLRGSIILDHVNNLSGGIKNGSSMLTLFDLSLSYSFNNGLLKNTSFHTHILKTAGNSASENLIGDIQIASNIDGYASHFVYELLIKQKIADFSITAGMHDLNSDFMASEFAGDFINSSFGISPVVTLNVPVSVFPITTFGGLLTYDNEALNIKTGFYNLNHDYVYEESFNAENHFFQHGFLSVTEIAYRILNDKSIKGEYKIGGYLKQCDHHQHESLPNDCIEELNYGFYFIGDQTIKELSGGQHLSAFVQLNFAPQHANFATEYYGAGLSLRELSTKWLPDQIGLAIGTVKLNHLLNSGIVKRDKFETVVELTAQIPVFNYFTIQPDFQYIINPSGIYNNSFTGLIRLIMELH